MKILCKIISVIVFTIALINLNGCTVYPTHRHHEGYGPPPHAPAHGYRAKYQHHDLVYDSHLGVYVVIGLSNHYYHDGHYYRHDHNGWYHSREIDKHWQKYPDKNIPPGLAKKYNQGGDGNNRNRGKNKDRN